jgi:hypothetical protein
MAEEEETPRMKVEREFAQAGGEALEKLRIAFGMPPFLPEDEDAAATHGGLEEQP